MATITALYVYPVKGCAGIKVDKAAVQATGFALDRNWMVVLEDNGKFRTQRQLPKLALVQTSLPEAALLGAPSEDAALTLTAPGMSALQVPLTPPTGLPPRLIDCTCWEWSGKACDEGEVPAEWFTQYLGKPCRLVRFAGKPKPPGAASKADVDATRRLTEEEFAPSHEVAFPDGFPFLIASEESLEDLNKRLKQPLKMNRFRPNIVVRGTGPWSEDAWASLHIGSADRGVDFDSVKPCSRCKVTTIDQETAEVGDEPLKALQAFRSGEVLEYWHQKEFTHKQHSKAVHFGWNLVPRQEGEVAVGDALQVLAARPGVGSNAAAA
ncbi:hypothetical protein WJX72_009040 [[Myrmecia] bisecta]|uniref:MOSC domain-containing protein n=1 Tax=[Myrmecia] bisecta TaxID=41462 RepID=A0AAW1PUX9_9CHLO